MLGQEIIEKALGIAAPWHVVAVEADTLKRKVLVRIKCGPHAWSNDGGILHVHAWERRRWRHLNLWNMQTIIEAEVPRLKDPRTGRTEMASVPWAEPHSRWTLEFEAHAIALLEEVRSTKAACRLLKLNWDSADAIQKRAVARGLARRGALEVPEAGVDEKSFGSGQSFVSIMTDLRGNRVLEVVEGADKEAVITLWQTLPEEQRSKVEAAAMDRGAAMIAGTQAAVPQAVIVHDKFHISQDQNKAVDAVRRAEHKKLMAEGDETLKGSKYIWLKGLERQSDAAFATFNHLVRLNLKTAKAWELKMTFEGFWNQPDESSGKAFFEKWHRRAMRSKLPEFIKLARSLADSLPRLLNYFKFRITNALTEGFNSVIQQLRAAARGFGNFASYRARILFHCGKLDLYPTIPSHGNP